MGKDNSPERVFIIAEAGDNHNGKVEIALQLIDVAVKAGADAVKFQTFKTEAVLSRRAPKAAYQKDVTGLAESYYDMAKRLELSEDEFRLLFDHCKEKGIMFLSTPFDFQSIDFLVGLGINIIKIPSCEITYLPYLRKIGSLRKPIIMSTGLANLQEVKAAVDVLVRSGTPKAMLTLLHCNVEYPTPMEDVNLRAMLTLKETFGTKVGYSDHTIGLEVPIAVAALGAAVIEKHFTLDKSMEGPDHKASLDPVELMNLVKAIRNIEKIMGDGVKRVTPSEGKNKVVVRRSLVAAREIKAGEVFSEENVTAKRPGTGLDPMLWDKVMGRRAKKNFAREDKIEL